MADSNDDDDDDAGDERASSREDGEAIQEEWQRVRTEREAGFAASAVIDSELDPKRRALWEQLRRASELDAVKAARESLEVTDEDEEPPDWRTRSRALSELQYWLIATGNPDAEAALLDMIKRHSDTDRWVAAEADGLLRKAWSVHRDATVNLRMEEARAKLRAGNAQEALSAFERLAKSVDPPWSEAFRWQAKVAHLALGDVDAAIELYDAALKLSPKNYPILFELGALLVTDAAAQAQMGLSRGQGTAEQATRGAELLGRAAELNPLLEDKVAGLLGRDADD